jgi:D-alanine-D-alanine ligase
MALTLPPLKVAVLHYQPSSEPMDPVVTHITDALTELGHQASTISVHDRVFDILSAIEASRCDLVFNLCETFADDYRMEVNVAALMEMARVPFTGSGTAGLLLAQDKILAKQLLEYHEVRTPNFATFDGEAFETHGVLRFPLIVKPARTDSSIGIGTHSLVQEWEELTKRVREIRKELDDEALAEEFIEGREVYVGVVGGPRPEILPIVELDWGNWDPARPQISDREVKFGAETEGSPRLVMAKGLSDDLRNRIERSALLAFRTLKLRDYARIDFRVSQETGEAFVLEANPNPYLEKESELSMGAKERGWSYPQLVGRILDSAAARYKIGRKAPAAAVPTADAKAGMEPKEPELTNIEPLSAGSLVAPAEPVAAPTPEKKPEGRTRKAAEPPAGSGA